MAIFGACLNQNANYFTESVVGYVSTTAFLTQAHPGGSQCQCRISYIYGIGSLCYSFCNPKHKMLGIYQLHLSFYDPVLLSVVQKPIKRSLLNKLGCIQLAAFRLQIQNCHRHGTLRHSSGPNLP